MFVFFKAVCDSLLDILFPLSKRSERVRTYTPDELEVTPMIHSACGIEIVTLARYHTSTIEDAIKALKYERSVPAARLLSEMLTDYLLDLTSEHDAFSDRTLVLVPMPLATKREKERGYNQIELVLNELSLDLPVRPDLLFRTRETPPQTKLPRAERLRNVTGAFTTADDVSLSDLHIVLVDDVTTTGATLAEAAHILQGNGAEVTALAFAHA
jgi:ComF family protein